MSKRKQALEELFDRLRDLHGREVDRLAQKSGLDRSTIYFLRRRFEHLAHARGKTLEALEQGFEAFDTPEA